MFTLKGPQIHFWISDKAVCRCEPPATNSEAGECSCTDLPAQQPSVEDQKQRNLPPYFHVEIF